MKISLLTVSNNEIISSENSIKMLSSQLYKNGFEIVSCQLLKAKSEIVLNSLKSLFKISDCVLFISDNDFEKCYFCKKIICEVFNTELVVNSFAKSNIEKYSKKFNVPLKKEDSSYSQLPKIARCIKNTTSAFQGFLIEKDSKILFFLTLSESLSDMFLSSVLPYLLQSAKGELSTSYVFKTFGIKSNEMALLLRDFIKNKYGIEVIFSQYLLSGEIIVNAPIKIKKEVLDNFIQNLYSKILPYVYSDSDCSMTEMIFSLLSLTNKKLAFSEDFTCGKMSSLFLENSHEKVLKESYIVPDFISKTKILGVEEEIFKKNPLDYSEIAYQMALGTLENSRADIVVCNCGSLEEGEVFFAIGSPEGIHIFNQKVEGSRKQKIVMASNAIFFRLIKKIKQNDFHLGQTTV